MVYHMSMVPLIWFVVQAKIDQLVSSSLTTGDGLYGVDNAAMAQQNPDLIITQELCTVCAPSTVHIASALEAVAQRRQAASAEAELASDAGEPLALPVPARSTLQRRTCKTGLLA